MAGVVVAAQRRACPGANDQSALCCVPRERLRVELQRFNHPDGRTCMMRHSRMVVAGLLAVLASLLLAPLASSRLASTARSPATTIRECLIMHVLPSGWT